MGRAITILDKEYLQWIRELGTRYRQSQIKAAVKVNEEMLRFYWELGRDIVEMHIEERWGEGVIDNLVADIKREIPNISGISRRNVYYCKQLYGLYSQYVAIVPRVVAQIGKEKDNLVAQYALEASSQPLGISEYELAKLYSEKVEGTIPTIEELEKQLERRLLKKED